MNDKARIALAEAMGWKSIGNWGETIKPGVTQSLYGIWEKPNSTHRYSVPPDPFTDANDDYKVLEWMRKEIPQECKFQHSLMFGKLAIEYQIGDFARAACKVLGIDDAE